MKDFNFFLDRLSCFSGVDILCFCIDRHFHYREYADFNPFVENVEFRDSLMKAADEQDVPQVLVELHYYYRDYGMKKGTEKPLPVLHFTKILELVEPAAGLAYWSAKRGCRTILRRQPRFLSGVLIWIIYFGKFNA